MGNKKSSVAVCTLTSTDLPEKIFNNAKEKIAIIGFCETENIGIEKIVKNIITNSNIRYLILRGKDSDKGKKGHLSGQAIFSLHRKFRKSNCAKKPEPFIGTGF